LNTKHEKERKKKLFTSELAAQQRPAPRQFQESMSRIIISFDFEWTVYRTKACINIISIRKEWKGKKQVFFVECSID
jgi:hypothetical protein